MNPWEFGIDIAFSYNNLGPVSTFVEFSDFFFLRVRAIKFQSVARGSGRPLGWEIYLKLLFGRKKRVENCLIRPIFQPTNPVILTVLNCWPLPSVSGSVAGTLPSNKDPCYLIRKYLLKVIMVHNQYLALWNTISSFKNVEVWGLN